MPLYSFTLAMSWLNDDGCVSSRRQKRFYCATWSLAHLTPLTYSAALGIAPITGLLTYYARSLRGRLKLMNVCSCCDRIQWEQLRLLSSLETSPLGESLSST